MPIKTTVKIGILFFAIIFIIVGGIVMFKTLKHDKEVLAINLQNYIPTEIVSVLQINKQKDLIAFSNFIEILDTVFDKISEVNLTYPLFLINDSNNTTLLARVTSEQEELIKQNLKLHFKDFPAKHRMYKNVNIYFYPNNNSSFYCIMFYHGIFACSYNYKQLEQIIDTQKNNSFFDKPTIKEILGKTNNLYSASFYTIYNESAIILNILANKSDLKFEGYSSNNSINNQSDNKQDVTINSLNYSIFPNNPVAFDIVNSDQQSFIAKSITRFFDKPYYIFYLDNDTKNAVYALKHKGDKFQLYNHLNDLELIFTGKKFDINDFVADKQRLYTASGKMSYNIFRKKNTVSFTFYKEHLIYSDNRSALVEYLTNNGQYIQPDSILVENIATDSQTDQINKYIYRSGVCKLNNIYNLETFFNKENLYLYANEALQNDEVLINVLVTK